MVLDYRKESLFSVWFVAVSFAVVICAFVWSGFWEPWWDHLWWMDFCIPSVPQQGGSSWGRCYEYLSNFHLLMRKHKFILRITWTPLQSVWICDSWMLAISLVDFFKKAVNSSDHWQMQSKPEGTGKQWKLAEFSIYCLAVRRGSLC